MVHLLVCALWFAVLQPPVPRVTVGFIVRDLDEAWFRAEAKWAEKAGRQDGFDVLVIGASTPQEVSVAIDRLAQQGAMGFVLSSPDPRGGPAVIRKAAKYHMKFMTVDDRLMNGKDRYPNVPHMGLSTRLLGAQVASALRGEMGRRQWKDSETGLLVTTMEVLTTARDRTESEIQTLEADGFPKSHIFRAGVRSTDVEGGFEAATQVLAAHKSFKRWIICGMNDDTVIGAVRATEKAGLAVDRVLAVGLGGAKPAQEEFAKQAPTGFWGTILISPRRHGYDAAEMVFKWIVKGIVPPMTTVDAGILMTRIDYPGKIKDLDPSER